MNKKKLIILLSIVVLLITGCSVHKLDNNLGSNIKYLLSHKSNIHNVNLDGYKYYVPKGIKFLSKEEYNSVLLDKYDNKYYLFVDVVAYYHKKQIDYKINNNSHYSKVLNFNGKKGYIQIDELKNTYFVQYMYNYSKIEAYVKKENLNDAIIEMSYILRSVEFNKHVLESLIGNNILSYKEENYSLFDKKSSETFLDVVEKYEDDAYKKAIEDETIELDEE